MSPVVSRYVVTNRGVEELQDRFGWETFWWHTAAGVSALARRLEVLEMAYIYLPLLWRSNLVSDPSCHMFREWEEIAWQNGEPVTRVELVKADWSNGRLIDFVWMKDGPFEAFAIYRNNNPDDGFLLIPVLWRGSFQKPQDVAWVRDDMKKALVEDKRWSKLRMEQSLGNYYPGMVIFCPDRVAAAVAQRNWVNSLEGKSRDFGALPAIIDAQGQVVRPMDPPVSRWEAYYTPPRAGEPERYRASRGLPGQGGLRHRQRAEGIPGIPGYRRLSRGDPGADIGIHKCG